MKVQRKGKTVFWLSLSDKTFRTTFYFPVKTEQVIMDSNVSDALKNQFLAGKKSLKNSSITVYFRNKKDIEQAKILCGLKLGLM